MNSQDANAVMDRATQYARDHLVECCQELVDMKANSILKSDGRVRKIADILSPLLVYNRLSLAEQLVVTEALKRIADAPRNLV